MAHPVMVRRRTSTGAMESVEIMTEGERHYNFTTMVSWLGRVRSYPHPACACVPLL